MFLGVQNLFSTAFLLLFGMVFPALTIPLLKLDGDKKSFKYLASLYFSNDHSRDDWARVIYLRGFVFFVFISVGVLRRFYGISCGNLVCEVSWTSP